MSIASTNDQLVALTEPGSTPARDDWHTRNVCAADQLTARVIVEMERTRDDRLRAILIELVSHLHSFVRATRMTEVEFRNATTLINQLGQNSGPSHNETVLMAGSLGVSTLISLLNNGEGQDNYQGLLGPFFRLGAPSVEQGGSIVRSPIDGERVHARISVHSQDRRPIAGATVHIWQASPLGLYENQDETQANMNLRATMITDDQGLIEFDTIRPAGYPIPTDGVVGRMLNEQGRHALRPAHIHLLVYKSGFKTLISQVYDAEDPILGSDVQFGVTPALTGHFRRAQDATLLRLDHTLVMYPGDAVMPTAPIN